MKIAFLSDIHGNAIALDRCLERLQKLQVDETYFLGDAVGYMPAAREVLNRLRREQIQCQQGNHERMLLSPTSHSQEREGIYRLRQTHAQLEPEQLRMVASWPISREVTKNDRSLLMVHGSPRSMLDGYVYPDTDLTEYHTLPHHAVVMGHTHRPFVRKTGGKWFVNTGSVGLPRDQGNLASFAIYDTRDHKFEIIRVVFDVDAVLVAYGSQLAESVQICLRRCGRKGVPND